MWGWSEVMGVSVSSPATGEGLRVAILVAHEIVARPDADLGHAAERLHRARGRAGAHQRLVPRKVFAVEFVVLRHRPDVGAQLGAEHAGRAGDPGAMAGDAAHLRRARRGAISFTRGGAAMTAATQRADTMNRTMGVSGVRRAGARSTASVAAHVRRRTVVSMGRRSPDR